MSSEKFGYLPPEIKKNYYLAAAETPLQPKRESNSVPVDTAKQGPLESEKIAKILFRKIRKKLILELQSCYSKFSPAIAKKVYRFPSVLQIFFNNILTILFLSVIYRKKTPQ